MTPEQLGQFLDELGKRLGPAGDHVWQIAVQRAVISNAVWLVGSVVLVIASVWAARWLWKVTADVDDVDQGMLRIFGSLGTAAGAVAGTAIALGSLINLMTPEYKALSDLLSAIGGVK